MQVWDIPTKSLLLSVVCPTFLTAVAVDQLEMRVFMGGGDGRIFEVTSPPPRLLAATLAD